MKLGTAFSDSLIIEKKTVNRLHESGSPWWYGAGRALFFATILVVSFFILTLRLFHLTLVQGHYYRLLADGNRTRELIRHAPRAVLFDRTGKPLTVNLPKLRGDGQFAESDWQRQYPFDTALSSVIGYTSEVNSSELSDDYYALRRYRPGDRIGRVGAEAVFEEKLRGRDGRELVEVDAAGKILRTLGIDEAQSGQDVTLAVDAALAQVAEQAFPAGAKGAIVVSKPSTGEILALFTSPSFSANGFAQGLSQADYENLVNDPDRPLFNRAIGGVYPPGSTFKIVTALSALEEGAVKPTTLVEDTGVLTIGPFNFPNWYFVQYGKLEGSVDIVKAIQRSNDIYFYKAGEWLGITKLAAWARRAGLGQPLGIELPGEAAGLMPDPVWKNSHFTSQNDLVARNNQWYLGDTYHVAIGQGYLLTTPLQVNAWTNIIANGGKLCRPTLKKWESGSRNQEAESCKDLGIKKETIELITEGMRKACEPGGTGWPLFNFQISKLDQLDKLGADNPPKAVERRLWVPVACKTGTAEFGDPAERTHAWFTAFAPLRPAERDFAGQAPSVEKIISGEPEISVTVLVESAGQGSDIAAPIAKKIFEEWFSR